jgi:hypothetical protein
MGESHDERLARKKRERKEYLKRQEEQDKALEEAMAREPQLADYIDYDFERQIKQMTGVSMEEMRRVEAGGNVSESDVDEAMRVIAEAKRAAEGGFLRSKNPKKAEKMIKNSKAVKKVGGAAKKGKGCALVILAGSGATSIALVWAAVDLVSRMFS